jgi:hypothetical protein
MSIKRVTFSGLTIAGVCQNVVHFHDPDGSQTHPALAAYLIANWINPLRTVQNNNFSWIQLLIQTVDGPTPPASVHPISPGGGGSFGDMAAPFVTALFQIHTSAPGRKGRGRIFIPGMSIGEFVDRGRLDSGSYGLFQTNVLNGWRTKFLLGGTAPVTLGVCSRSNPTDFSAAEFIDVRQWAACQRRRNYFVGI